MQKIVIFGTGELAQRIFYYLKDAEDEVVAFSANKSNINLTNVLVGPFANQNDIKDNQEILNKIAGIEAGEVMAWNP